MPKNATVFVIDGRSMTDTELVHDYYKLVKALALTMPEKRPTHVDIEDVVNEGLGGLLQAARTYDATIGCKFFPYAKPRILGAMSDLWRNSDWAPRTVRTDGRKITKARKAFQDRCGRNPSRDELANALHVTRNELDRMLNRALKSTIVSLDEPVAVEGGIFTRADLVADERVDITGEIEHRELRDLLMSVLDELPQVEQEVFHLYFIAGKTISAIHEDVGFSESQVQRLKARAVTRLQQYLQEPHRKEQLAMHGFFIKERRAHPARGANRGQVDALE